MKILILCTGNSCRSQMAEGFLKSLDHNLKVYSAGTEPAGKVNPMAIRAMKESGINIENQTPENVEEFLNDAFDYVITVCDGAKESCPVFTGSVKHRLHIGFEDPADAKGEEEDVIEIYRKVRDQIKIEFEKLYYDRIIKVV